MLWGSVGVTAELLSFMRGILRSIVSLLLDSFIATVSPPPIASYSV